MGKYPIPPHLNRDDPSRSLMMFAHAKPLGAYMGFAGLRSMRQICSGTIRPGSTSVFRKISTTAFPPNFIHSLDATHMLLTAIKCNDRGLTFASIHDSYWTHACDIDTMSEAIRETFISLHQSDILNKLQQATPPQAQWSDSPRHRLKIPAANLFGYDKAGSTSVFSGLRSTLSKCGRRRRTRSMYGMRWWQKADDPWQFLAACIELTK
ncbi:DNA-directed RNA polymerase 3, chloroplastic [Psilocybe cubensis]|uniref:DNA-directed RNA polymerase 3, chloroplastic n=1 Tax=Psilocybe cubensis TaxID=181762 RepID=A0ACB8GJC1_PSICU|nr:DNA-directed RNA polymerase 3, chloroplastic [Psilocybe cubensis]KAH9475704.1 DNA-directed RNA polymerase 3, chloroplastic [Psilocybe cubensis]